MALRSTNNSVLSLDVGTSGVRAALFDDQGNETRAVRIARNADSHSDFIELNPQSIVDEVIAAIDKLFQSVSPADRVEVITISTFWHSLLGIDASGTPTTPLLTWADTRATAIAKVLRGEFVEREIHERTGCRFHSSYWPAKLRWLEQNRSLAFKSTSQWLGFAEYLCLQLFNKVVASVSMGSATGLFNQRNCDWDWDFVKALKIAEDALPAIQQKIDESLSPRFLTRWPSLADAKLRVIIGDGAANNVGGGCCSRERIALMVGTSGAMRVVFSGEPPDQLPSSLWSYRIDAARVVVGGALSDGGGLYRWLTDSLILSETSDVEIAAMEPDSHGLTLLPFWSGERSTGWSGDARGAILGLTQKTQPAEIVRAAFESIAYRFALISQALESVAPDAQIVATGNALRSSPVWLQIIADVLGKQLTFGGSPEASIRGAALLGLEAVGKIGNIEEIPVEVEKVVASHEESLTRYQLAIARQERFYQKLISE